MGDVYTLVKNKDGEISLINDGGKTIVVQLIDSNTGIKCIKVKSDAILPLYSPETNQPLETVNPGDKVMICEAIPSDKTIII